MCGNMDFFVNCDGRPAHGHLNQVRRWTNPSPEATVLVQQDLRQQCFFFFFYFSFECACGCLERCSRPSWVVFDCVVRLNQISLSASEIVEILPVASKIK